VAFPLTMKGVIRLSWSNTAGWVSELMKAIVEGACRMSDSAASPFSTSPPDREPSGVKLGERGLTPPVREPSSQP
jgi:hypothetical protein